MSLGEKSVLTIPGYVYSLTSYFSNHRNTLPWGKEPIMALLVRDLSLVRCMRQQTPNAFEKLPQTMY